MSIYISVVQNINNYLTLIYKDANNDNDDEVEKLVAFDVEKGCTIPVTSSLLLSASHVLSSTLQVFTLHLLRSLN